MSAGQVFIHTFKAVSFSFPALLPLSSFYFDIYPYLFITYLGVPGLGCGILDILVVACELLIVACGI